MVPQDAGHPVKFLAIIAAEESARFVLNGYGVAEVGVGQVVADHNLLVDFPGSAAVFGKASTDAEWCDATAVCAEQTTILKDEEMAWQPKHGRGFRHTPTVSSIKRSASVQIAAFPLTQDAIELSWSDFGHIRLGKPNVDIGNENWWIPAFTTSAREQNVGDVWGAIRRTYNACNASIPQFHHTIPALTAAIRRSVDLDCVFKGVSSVSAEMYIEALIAAGPVLFGLGPIFVRQVFGPAAAAHRERNWLACRPHFSG